MGYNTAILVLNDLEDQLCHPDAGNAIQNGIRESFGIRDTVHVHIGNGSPVTVLQPRHADETQLIVVGQNNIECIARLYCGNEPEDILREFASSLGFSVSKKKVR